MNQDHIKDKDEEIGWLAPVAVVFFVFLCFGLNWWFLYRDIENRGTFGDMFGAVNSLFSGLAFVGVVFAILLQRNELVLQRKELKFTRDELEGQKIQLEAQNTTLKKQNFENTFFELLRMQNEIIQSIDLVDSDRNITSGRDCFRVFYRRFNKVWRADDPKLRGETEHERINNTYMHFYQSYQDEIGHYFRCLYNLVKFVDNSQIKEKRLYTNIIRAQLSSNELALLFYNSLSVMGRDKFKPLIEKYSLLKTVPQNILFNLIEHKPLYSPSAYDTTESHNNAN